MSASEKLKNLVPKNRKYASGICSSDIDGLALTRELKDDILAAVASDIAADVRLGLFFAEVLVCKSDDREFERDLIGAALRQVKTSEWGIPASSLALIILLEPDLSKHRELVLDALKDKDPAVRGQAIRAYSTFAKPKELAPLEALEADSHVAELGMGSPCLIYDIRNEALEAIEHVIGRTFPKAERAQVLEDGAVAFWWDWKPFHDWKKSWWRKLGL